MIGVHLINFPTTFTETTEKFDQGCRQNSHLQGAIQ